MNESNELIRRPRPVQALTGHVEAPLPRPPFESYDTEVDAVEEPNLRDYWRSIRKHKWLVIGIPVFCTVLAAVYLFRRHQILTAGRVVVRIEQYLRDG